MLPLIRLSFDICACEKCLVDRIPKLLRSLNAALHMSGDGRVGDKVPVSDQVSTDDESKGDNPPVVVEVRNPVEVNDRGSNGIVDSNLFQRLARYGSGQNGLLNGFVNSQGVSRLVDPESSGGN